MTVQNWFQFVVTADVHDPEHRHGLGIRFVSLLPSGEYLTDFQGGSSDERVTRFQVEFERFRGWKCGKCFRAIILESLV